MHLKDPLCQVDPNDRRLLHGCLLLWLVTQLTSVAHFDAVGRGHPPHQILTLAAISKLVSDCARGDLSAGGWFVIAKAVNAKLSRCLRSFCCSIGRGNECTCAFPVWYPALRRVIVSRPLE